MVSFVWFSYPVHPVYPCEIVRGLCFLADFWSVDLSLKAKNVKAHGETMGKKILSMIRTL